MNLFNVWELRRLETLRRRQQRLEQQEADAFRTEHQLHWIRAELSALRWVLEVLDEAHADMPLSQAVTIARHREEEG